MMMDETNKRTIAEKIALFKRYFSGLPNVFGTYDPDTGRSWQEKRLVTSETILTHLKGKRHYGVYLLVNDITKAIVTDFDNHDSSKPLEFIRAAHHYRLPAYIEISKSKGFHVWIFFNEHGVKADKARLVVKTIMKDIDSAQTEIFPKQNSLNSQVSFGNFIYAPLFGRLVPEGKTVFIEPETMKPHQNQWDFLESIQRVEESILDDIIEINGLTGQQPPDNRTNQSKERPVQGTGLPLCTQSMLQNGVTQFQRSSCFRLAVQLRRIGLPFDATVSVLKTWSLKNKPDDGKRIITDQEIVEQATCAYRNYYQAYGCETPEVARFCLAECHLFAKRRNRGEVC
ncbi:MAG: hypothetical protein M1418_06075 [Deltaproteobacteria bacterium]|nr:hypothetical protein [Deltaproteobacteria bacterium]